MRQADFCLWFAVVVVSHPAVCSAAAAAASVVAGVLLVCMGQLDSVEARDQVCNCYCQHIVNKYPLETRQMPTVDYSPLSRDTAEDADTASPPVLHHINYSLFTLRKPRSPLILNRPRFS